MRLVHISSYISHTGRMNLQWEVRRQVLQDGRDDQHLD
jgi:hypothetical protein